MSPNIWSDTLKKTKQIFAWISHRNPDNRFTFLDLPLWLVTFGCWFMKTWDAILSFFGYKMHKITIDNVLYNLEPDVRAQALHPDLQQPLSLLLHGLQLDNEMGAMSRLFQTSQIRQVLRRRARIARCLQEHPDITKVPIKRPLFIIGFPRSGTTMLHHLLAQDPQFEAPMLWQLTFPHRPGKPDDWKNDHRYKRMARILEVWRASDDITLDTAHEVQASHPEECVFILQDFLFWIHCFIRCRSLAGFAEWFYKLDKKEMIHIYQHYKEVLQMIGYGQLEGRHLLLKSHLHLMHLEELLEVFPDAQLVFTYRKMTELLPSFCSLMVQCTYNWGAVEHDIGERVVRLVSEFANRTVRFMKTYDNVPQEERPFCNIDYTDLVRDPITTMKRLYNQCGYTMTSQTEQGMKDWLQRNPQHKHGRHKYSMEQYSLSEQDIVKNFGPYLDYFGKYSDNLI